MLRERYEISFSDDNVSYTPFVEFKFGDVVLLTKYVRFRVTTWGDFEPHEYRFRGWSGIVSDATTTVGGFGLSPFGRYPFGDGGMCEESFSVSSATSGTLTLSGELEIGHSGSMSGGISLSGTLAITVQHNVPLSGAISWSGELDYVLFSGS